LNVIGFDDGPFPRDHRGDVLLVGAVCSRTRLDGVVSGHVRRDGANATQTMVELVRDSKFGGTIRAVVLQGVAVAGFNVVDVRELSSSLDVPVLVVMRHRPDIDAMKRALFSDVPRMRPRVRGAARKWALIQKAGPIEPLAPSPRLARGPALTGPTGLRSGGPRLWVQRVGLSPEAARDLVDATTLHGHVPEPVRVAHLIAGGIVAGSSRGRA
jgi:endonuclease V-like protein UPF0215 family